jgi:chemotaxis protein CheX
MTEVIEGEAIAKLIAKHATRSSMDARILTPFLQSAVEVLTAEIGGTIERGQISIQSSSYATADVNVILTLVGRLQGVVIYGMSTDTALGMVSSMIGQRLTELDELAQSGVAELGNVITGRASTLLAASGYVCNLSVPTLVIGRAMISVLDFQRVAVPLSCRHGLIEVHLALREVPPDKA